MRSFMSGGARCSPVAIKCFISLKIHGEPMLARPIIIPSTPKRSRYSTVFSGVSMSPFPKTGIFILGLFFTAAIKDQSASPLYICALVRP